MAIVLLLALAACGAPFEERLARVHTLLVLHRLGDADQEAAELAGVVGADVEAAQKADYWNATLRAYHHDLDGARRILEGVRRADAARGDAVGEAYMSNCLTWVRWAGRDPEGALAENAKMLEAVARIGDPETRRDWELHATWDHAYLEADVGAPDAAEARARYEALAAHPDDDDGVNVLAAWFALRAGDAAGAADAARRVSKGDGDAQDLWIVRQSLEAAGDAAGAAAIGARLRRSAYLMPPLLEIYDDQRRR
jgi:hypothetical protein